MAVVANQDDAPYLMGRLCLRKPIIMYAEWYTVAQVAAKEDCCEKTIRNYIKLGYLKAHRRGRRNIFIHIDDYDNMYRPYGKSYLRKF